MVKIEVRLLGSLEFSSLLLWAWVRVQVNFSPHYFLHERRDHNDYVTFVWFIVTIVTKYVCTRLRPDVFSFFVCFRITWLREYSYEVCTTVCCVRNSKDRPF
jgi:hypothetical protein